jgi:hypothetical protein
VHNIRPATKDLNNPTVHIENICTTIELALLLKKISDREEKNLPQQFLKTNLTYCKNNVLSKTTCKEMLR